MRQDPNSANGNGNGNGRLMTMNQAAEFLKVSKPTLYRLLEQGKLKGHKAGNQWRFRPADLTAYLERDPATANYDEVPIDAALAEITHFADALQRQGESPETPLPAKPTPEEVISRLAGDIITLGLLSSASDIHLEACHEDKAGYYLLRYRIDGVMHEIRRFPAALGEGLLTRFKTWMMLPLDCRLPMDGRMKMRVHDRSFDVRGAMIPTIFGTSAVLRLLDAKSILLGIDHLGLSAADVARLKSWMGRSHGLIVVTGPSGSGKTTLVYSLLQQIADVQRKTMTVESPVELALPWTTQMQARPETGLTFVQGIRAAMRQDPDVIMIGEIRDPESLKLALQAALTGHLVITVLHAPDAAAAIRRMGEMGAEPFLIASALIGVVAVRLARRICSRCGKPVRIDKGALEARLTAAESQSGFRRPSRPAFRAGSGCPDCHQTGHRGRTGVFEVLEFTSTIRDTFLAGATPEKLRQAARAEGMVSLLGDALRQAAEGAISLDEAFRTFPPTDGAEI